MFRQSTWIKITTPGFQVVVTSLDGINGWLIQTLLRGENDLKQSDEIQAIWFDHEFETERKIWTKDNIETIYTKISEQKIHPY